MMEYRDRDKFKNAMTAFINGMIWLLVINGCTFLGIQTVEEANYNVIAKHDQIELREYSELVIVETTVDAEYEEAGDIAFKKLFGYLSGENISKSKIAMTAPVLSSEGIAAKGERVALTAPVIGEKQPAGWRYMFVLPAEYTLENAPLPSNPDVKISLIPAKKVAVIRYTGSWGEDEMRKKMNALAIWLRKKGLSPASKASFARYDPPWTLPFLRRNEIMIDVR